MPEFNPATRLPRAVRDESPQDIARRVSQAMLGDPSANYTPPSVQSIIPNFPALVVAPGDYARSTPVTIQQLSVAALESTIPILYGQAAVGGLLCNVLLYTTPTPDVWYFWVIWGAAISGYNSVYVNDNNLVAGVSTNDYTGAAGQTYDTQLAAAFSNNGHGGFTEACPGIAYSVIKIPDDGTITAQPKLTAALYGRIIYDPRLDSTNGGSGSQRKDTPSTWTWVGGGSGSGGNFPNASGRNPALILADFLRYQDGKDVDWPSVIVAANACYATVQSEIDRNCDIVIDREQPDSAWIATLATAANCLVVPQGDTVKLVPDVSGSSLATYAHASAHIIAITNESIASPSSLPTVMEIGYTNTSGSTHKWKEDTVRVSVPGVGSNILSRKSTAIMPWIIRSTQATRECYQRLNKLRQRAMTMTVELFDEGLLHEPGDIITLTYPDSGYDALVVKVASVAPTANGWALDCFRESAKAYTYDAVEVTVAAGLQSGYELHFVAASSQYLSIPDSTALSPSSQMTVEFWTRQTAGQATAALAAHCKLGTDAAWHIQTGSVGTELQFMTAASAGDTGSNFGATASGALAANVRTHVAMVFDGTKSTNATRLRAFANCVEQALSFTGTIPSTLRNAAGVLTVAALDPSGSAAHYFSGNVDELRIWNTARTPLQILEGMNRTMTGTETGLVGCWHFDEGSGTNAVDAVSANNGTTHGTPTWVAVP